MYSKEMVITPELAKKWLESKNNLNRRISESVVKRYAADMRGGYWQLNGEAIEISSSGELKNGQHRLAAVIMANVPIKMYVTFDVPDDVNIYDVHYKRSDANAAQLLGIDIGKNETAICKFLFEYVGGNKNIGSGVLIDFIRDEWPSLKEAKKIVSTNNASVMSKASCYSAAWVMLKNGYSYPLMDRFFEVAETGFYEDGEEAAIALRNMILSKKVTAANFVERKKLFKATCKALSDFKSGRARKLMYREFEIEKYDCLTGSNAEAIVKSYLR